MKRVAAAAGLLSPASALMLVGFVLPMAWLIRLSLDRSEEGGVLVPDLTAANYTHFARDPFYLAILLRTLILGVVVALITSDLRLSDRAVPVPHAQPLAGRSRCSHDLAHAGEFRRPHLRLDGNPRRSRADQSGASGTRASSLIRSPLMNNMLGVVIGLVQIEMPVMILALMAGLSRLDPTLEEAAQTLGAKPWRSFLRVTLPLSAPGIVLGCLITFVQVISSFITPTLLGGGRVYVMATTIYEEALETLNWPLAAAISIILIVVFALCAVAYERFSRRAAQ